MRRRYYKEESRKDWYVELEENTSLPMDRIQLGAVLRIADAMEKIAQSHVRLINELQEAKESLRVERKRNAALRGIIKRLKK